MIKNFTPVNSSKRIHCSFSSGNGVRIAKNSQIDDLQVARVTLFRSSTNPKNSFDLPYFHSQFRELAPYVHEVCVSINPLIVSDGRPVAVDASVIVDA